MARCGWWLVGALLLGCSAERGDVKPVVRVPWGSSEASAAGALKARWAYTPTAPRGLVGRTTIEPGQELYFGRRGERWLVTGGEAVAAGDLAEQDLVAVGRGGGGAWLFIGEGGAIFEADEPLGPFRRALAAPEPVARVEASGQGLLAVTLRGALLRSGDGGATFQRSPLEAPFAADVQLLDGGQGLLLAYPERLFETRDGGLQWKPLEAQPVGAMKLHRYGEDGILVQGTRTSLLWKQGAPLRPSKAQPESAIFTLPVALAPAPSASDLALGQGFWRGNQLHVVRPPGRKTEPWLLGTAKLGQRLTLAPLEGTEGCQRLVIDGNEQGMMAACSTVPRGSSMAAVKLLRYGAGGDAPEVMGGTLEGSLGEVRLSLGRDGRALVWGACRAGDRRSACDGDGLLLLPRFVPSPAPAEGEPKPDGPRPDSPWVSVAAPGQAGRPVAVRFGGTGSLAYMVAQRGKTRDLGLFVSRDGGKSFESRDLGLAGALEESDRRLLSDLRNASLSTLDEGIVSVSFEGHFGALVAVTDEDGRVLSVAAAPAASSQTRVGLAGRRVLVTDGPSAVESLDGGVSWQPLGEVPALRCPERGSCEHPVMCSAAGCLVGEDASRLGWGGQSEGRRAVDPSAAAVGPSRPAPPPMVCRLSKEKWQPLPRGAELPSASRADRGKTAWAATAFVPSTGQVTAVHGLPSGKIEEVSILPAARDPARVAMEVSLSQVEGVGVVRVERSQQAQARVEVAWENLFEGKLSRGTVTPSGTTTHLIRDNGPALVATLELPLLSISNGGIFLRFDNVSAGDLYFLDHRGKVDHTAYPAPPGQDVNGDDLSFRVEAVRADGKSVPIGYRDNLVARFRERGDYDAFALFPPAGSAFGPASETSFSYLNGTPYLVHMGFIPRVGASVTSLFPFQAGPSLLGARLSGPSQSALVDRYRPCAAADRSKSPRVVAPAELGTRRGVLVEGPDGSAFASMVSGAMVLYGTAESPCSSVLEALPAREEARNDERERALVFSGDLDHSWFFRAGVGDVIEGRMMSCKLSPGTLLPPEILGALDQAVQGGITVRRPQRPVRRPRRP